MKPSFALSLSFDGIRLLHRAAGGWRVVGDAALDAADLGAELAGLRKTATDLDIGAMRTKLLLPNEQIKYLSINTPGLDDGARRDAAIKALDQATPYPVADLAFDISADGDVTHIAAVARETLDEAEGFATEHQFNPVSFAAIPGDLPYLGEPYFGPTKSALGLLEPGEVVEADGIAVVVIGDLEPPAEPVPPAPVAAETEAVAEAEDIPPTPQEEPAENPAQPDPPSKEPQLSFGNRSEAAPETPADSPAAATPPAVGFASRRSQGKEKAPALGGASRTPPPPKEASPEEPMLLGQAEVSSGKIAVEPETPAFVAAPEPEPEPSPPAPRGGFLSRRRARTEAKAPPPPAPGPRVIPAAPAPITETDGSEQQRMTVFGARKSEPVGGKPRFLGLILTAALLVFLAGVAAWASVFLDDGLNLSRLFGPREPEAQFSDTPVVAAPETPATAPAPEVVTASLDPVLSDEDTAVLDALREPVQPQSPEPLTETELQARYAATGIWPVAPVVPPEPAGQIDLDDLYLTSIDPVSTAADAIALPATTGFATDEVLAAVANPPAAGTQFALDTRGLVIPTAQGAPSPDGFTVFLGKPPLTPPATPTRFQSAPQDTAIRSALAAFRPQPRPADLVENTERAQLDGLTRTELADYRPALRPRSLQQQAEAAARPEPETTAVSPEATNGAVALALATSSPFDGATQFATRASVRPDTRPRNFARVVKRAQRAKPAEEVRVASAAAVAPRAVTPKIPSKASVAKQATVKNALNLRKINLIGVYGKPSSRRALVRLGNGRYRKVVVGDRLDGGRVSAIGDSELRYTKRGRDLVLKMPR